MLPGIPPGILARTCFLPGVYAEIHAADSGTVAAEITAEILSGIFQKYPEEFFSRDPTKRPSWDSSNNSYRNPFVRAITTELSAKILPLGIPPGFYFQGFLEKKIPSDTSLRFF